MGVCLLHMTLGPAICCRPSQRMVSGVEQLTPCLPQLPHVALPSLTLLGSCRGVTSNMRSVNSLSFNFSCAIPTCSCSRSVQCCDHLACLFLWRHCREHKPYADQLEREHPETRNPRLGFLAMIAFPQFYSACFGEFGTRQCRYWTQQYASVGIPLRCCFLEVLSYSHGL